MALDPTVTVRELADADDITDAVVEAFARLIPQLSSSSPSSRCLRLERERPRVLAIDQVPAGGALAQRLFS